jgi:septal ring factor EnvC (AmiA/AmiB activator)
MTTKTPFSRRFHDKVVSLSSPKKLTEVVLNSHLELRDVVTQDTLEQLDDIQEDLDYVSQSIEQAKTRFTKVLAENRKLKTFLLQLVKECWCIEGNRCAKCQQILRVLSQIES